MADFGKMFPKVELYIEKMGLPYKEFIEIMLIGVY